ncbi:MAG: hypothetical protein AAGD12_15320 [Pseudomonadota bacterium]
MDRIAILDKVFEEQAVQAPVLTVSYQSDSAGWTGLVTHTVSEVIYSAFDRGFADYIYATTGQAMPRARVETLLSDSSGVVLRRATSGCLTVLEALVQIGQKATADAPRDMKVSPGDRCRHLALRDTLRSQRRDASDFEILAEARDLIAEIADPGLCRITATLEGASIQPPGGTSIFCEIDLERGLVTFPPQGDAESIKVPLMNFREAAREKPALGARLRALQESIAGARRMAVDAFGTACDLEVSRFNGSLAGRVLEGRVAEVAGDLMDRLMAAFGPQLRGLSPHARLITLDWLESGLSRKRLEHDFAA